MIIRIYDRYTLIVISNRSIFRIRSITHSLQQILLFANVIQLYLQMFSFNKLIVENGNTYLIFSHTFLCHLNGLL